MEYIIGFGAIVFLVVCGVSGGLAMVWLWRQVFGKWWERLDD